MIGHLLLLALASGVQGAWDVKLPVPHPDVPPAVKANKKKQAQEEPPPKPTREDLRRANFDWDVQFAPDNDLYRTYLADPRQSKSGSKVQYSMRRDTDSNNVKIENVLGGHRPLVGWTDAAHPDTEMQLQIEAAVFSRFDISEQWDMDAADYRFGFPFLYRIDDVILKLHLYHLTSHMGDEYLSRNEDAKRQSYHLEEFTVGFSWPFQAPWRVYAEVGAGVYTGPETGNGRAQVGAEWVFDRVGERIAPFVAVDLQTRNEIDWNWNASAMVGLMLVPKTGFHGNGLRAMLEYYRGNDAQTQFKEGREHYLAVGFAADF